ncbi:MAG: hypothetical protein AB1560_13215, partial [Pseudomonadota bacterium]
LLPLVASLGAVGSLTLMLATQAAPSDHAATRAEQQVRQMEYQSRVREWSQGLGFDLTGANVAFAKADRDDDDGYRRDKDD